MSSSRFPLCALLALAALGCSHEYQLVPFNAATAPLQRSQSKRVAVVLVPGIQDNYETSTDGHSFLFQNAQSFYEQLFRAALGKSVASVQVTRGPAPASFDAYVFPELSLEASGMLSHTCTARFVVTLKDARGTVVARNEKTAEGTFVPMAEAGQACTTAITAAFNATTYPTLAALDRW